ncbi:MAG: hypothetical protein IPI65_16995 [Bacteroidetes bacterium]|nr:hypothetical protein [Bacteroidota bacterium]
MTAILKLKAGIIPLDDDDSLKKFSDEISRTTLNNHIKAFAFDNDLYHILKAAKDARNEIAHEISVGCDMLFDSKPEDYLNQFIEQIRKLIINIAKGDRIISMLLSVATYEEVPGSMLLENYPESVANWVVNMDD